MNIGQQLSHYIIEDRLGDGGFGDVFRARDLNTGIEVAIKCSRPGDSNQLPDQQQRFMREVACSAKLCHPNIVQVYEYGALPDGTLYLVMEFVNGSNLEDLIKKSAPFSFTYACNILLQILDALGNAHANAIIHRDLKPANIMIVRQGSMDIVKLLDFGIAKAFDGTQPDLTQQFFQNSVGFGTPQYMPPEQFFGKNLGPHTDLYAIGLVFYEMLTGHQAFSGKALSDVIQKQLREFPNIPEPYNAGPLLDIFRVVLAKDVTMRYQSAAEMAAEIRNIFQMGGKWLQLYESHSSSRPEIEVSLETNILPVAEEGDKDKTGDMSAFSTIIVERVQPEEPQQMPLSETVIYDEFAEEDNAPTDDMSRVDPAYAPPTNQGRQGYVPEVRVVTRRNFQSTEINVATQAVRLSKVESMETQDLSRLELKDFSEANTCLVGHIDDKDMPAYLRATIPGNFDEDTPSPIFHQQRTEFLQNHIIDSRLSRETVMGVGSLWHRFMISRPILWLRTSALGRAFISVRVRISKTIDDLYEWHFGALVTCICLLIVILASIIVIIIIM